MERAVLASRLWTLWSWSHGWRIQVWSFSISSVPSLLSVFVTGSRWPGLVRSSFLLFKSTYRPFQIRIQFSIVERGTVCHRSLCFVKQYESNIFLYQIPFSLCIHSIRQYELKEHTDLNMNKIYTGELGRLKSFESQKPWVKYISWFRFSFANLRWWIWWRGCRKCRLILLRCSFHARPKLVVYGVDGTTLSVFSFEDLHCLCSQAFWCEEPFLGIGHCEPQAQ